MSVSKKSQDAKAGRIPISYRPLLSALYSPQMQMVWFLPFVNDSPRDEGRTDVASVGGRQNLAKRGV